MRVVIVVLVGNKKMLGVVVHTLENPVMEFISWLAGFCHNIIYYIIILFDNLAYHIISVLSSPRHKLLLSC